MKTILSRNNIIVSKNNIILPNNRHVRISETKTGGSIRKSITTTSFPIGITNTGNQPIKMSKNFGNTISYGGSLNQNLARLNFSDKNKNKNVRLRM
jgi:hypothetical protein